MENKNEKSMTLEEMIGEMLKDAKVVKVPLPVRAEEKTEVQKQDKPMPARPSSVPVLSLNIENLHVHMDERMVARFMSTSTSIGAEKQRSAASRQYSGSRHRKKLRLMICRPTSGRLREPQNSMKSGSQSWAITLALRCRAVHVRFWSSAMTWRTVTPRSLQ